MVLPDNFTLRHNKTASVEIHHGVIWSSIKSLGKTEQRGKKIGEIRAEFVDQITHGSWSKEKAYEE
jgi:hypothetical protein